VFSYLKEDNLLSTYTASKEYTESLTTPFPEFERIARNRPKKNIDPRYPKTTDGTTAATLRKLGKRVVQQLPTGVVETDDDNAWLPIVAGFIYLNKILPYANLEYDLIQKCWQVIEKGATFGATATYAPFINHDGYFCPDLTLPYWGDTFIQAGKKSGYDCKYVFLRSWWQPEDIDALIDQEKKLKKQAKERGEVYESTWDLKALEDIKDKTSKKPTEAETPTEKDRNVKTDAVEIITAFQNGVGATFYTFATASDESGEEEVTVLRRKKNKDPRGKMPIDWYYHDSDGANPLGRGIPELVGGLQNLIDADMQMYQFNRALMLAPPVVVRGIPKKKVVFAPNVIIDVGNSPDADVKPLTIDTAAVTNYPNLYGLQKSQLLNLVSSPDTSISAEIGNPGFGKTPSAINAQQANISVDDNHTRKNFEAWYEHWGETAINLYFAERTGVEELQLDKDTAQKLLKLVSEGKLVLEEPHLSALQNDNKIMIDYDTATPALKFRVDASTSKMKEDATQAEILTNLLASLEASPILSQTVPQEKILATWNRIVANSSVEDPEELTVDIEEFLQQQQMAQEQMAQQQMAMQQQLPAELPQEQMLDIGPEMPQEAMEQPSDAEQVFNQLASIGLPDSLLNEAGQALQTGEDPDLVLEGIQQLIAERA